MKRNFRAPNTRPTITDAERAPSRPASVGKAAGAVALAGLLVGGAVLYSDLKAESQQSPADSNTAAIAKLQSIESLPGQGMQVEAQTRAQLEASTVRVKFRPKNNPDAPAAERCTGNKVTIDGVGYVATAKHCFFTVSQTPFSKQNGSDIAFNIANVEPNTYEIAAADKNTTPIAQVTAISANMSRDWALLKVAPTPAFDAKPALRYGKSTDAAMAGKDVALSSLPGAAKGVHVKNTGTYLGRVTSDNLPYDLVGVSGSAAIACTPGGSGSAAQLASGAATGPLSLSPDLSRGRGERNDLLPYELASGVNESSLDRLCLYSVANETTIPALVAGFDQSVPPQFVTQTGERK